MARESDRRSVERRQLQRRSGPTLDFRRLAPLGEIAGGGEAILGYEIDASDGHVGTAMDFCIEEESWVVTGLLAAADRASGTIFVPLNAIQRIDQREKRIYASLSRDQLARGSRKHARS